MAKTYTEEEMAEAVRRGRVEAAKWQDILASLSAGTEVVIDRMLQLENLVVALTAEMPYMSLKVQVALVALGFSSTNSGNTWIKARTTATPVPTQHENN